MLKRVAVMLLCLMMVFIATFGFVVGVVAVPTIYSYAAVNDDSIYVPLRDPSDLVVGFQYYCKSRDLTIEGSLTDAVTTFTTGAFNSACNELGINVSQLQAELKAEYDQSGKPVKFLLNEFCVMAMNRIFAQFLQDNELAVGDENVNKLAYSGHVFENYDGTTCLATITDDYNSDYHSNYANILYMGSTFYYDSTFADITSSEQGTTKNCSVTVNISSKNQNLQTFNNEVKRNQSTVTWCGSTVARYSYGTNAWTYYNPFMTVFYRPSTNKYYYGIVFNDGTGYKTRTPNRDTPIYPKSESGSDIYIISTTINNNVYEGDTIINNDGDVITEPDPIPPGGTDPGWDIGGGGGTATDGDGNTWNIQFPDFELPDLNIDWSINGIGEKFPFSIPFDLVALVTVLNAEPQAPRFEGTVNFGFTTWNYDINLQQFNSVAQACRIAELLLLVVGLILVTRSIIKG